MYLHIQLSYKYILQFPYYYYIVCKKKEGKHYHLVKIYLAPETTSNRLRAGFAVDDWFAVWFLKVEEYIFDLYL